ncbi:MAG: tetratricopeptide repeat protein [Thermoguttaceae bacterium]|jgi:tetratricopeptide (TPR) repeat protein
MRKLSEHQVSATFFALLSSAFIASGLLLYVEPASCAPQSLDDANAVIRGQAPADDFPTLGDDFPTIGADFPLVDLGGPDAPPAESELSDFARSGATVAEPSGAVEPSNATDDPFLREPKRQSLADVEEKERALDDKYQSWLQQQKRKTRENSKTPRYLRPIEHSALDDENGPFAREQLEEDGDSDSIYMRRVTADVFSMMQDNELSNRELEEWEKETEPPIDWSKYALSLDRIRNWFGMGPDEEAALEYMRRACLKHKEYEETGNRVTLREAAIYYERAAERWPGPALRPKESAKIPFKAPKSGTLIEEDGLFFAGECWFFCKDYTRAVSCFRALVSTYTSTIYKETAMKRLFYIGNYWMACSEGEEKDPEEKGRPSFRSFAAGQKAYETIFLNDASDSGLAPAALFALANAYMRRGQQQGDGSYCSAAEYYRQLYEFYPGCKYAEDACRLRMIALHRSYQGVYYDSGPLDEARQLAETILKSGRGNMDVVYEELESIKEEQAKRLYALGQYYERRGNYASARSYYNRLVKEHPNADYATLAAQSYQEIRSKPAEADQLSWIRPIAPFLPEPSKEYFEEAPDENLIEIARRDSRLNAIGEKDYSTAEAFGRDDFATENARADDSRTLR